MLSKLLSLFAPWRKKRRRATHRHSRRDVGPTTTLQMNEGAVNWLRVRTPERDHDRVVSSAAAAWMNKLPPPLRPDALAAAHPRVLNRIALCWNDPELIERLFDELLVDTRGGR